MRLGSSGTWSIFRTIWPRSTFQSNSMQRMEKELFMIRIHIITDFFN
jgi:hypothetical protein